jgi:tetratricopeptide (TPR) repeat protein
MPALPPDPGLSGKLANLMALVHLEDPSRGDPALAKANLEEAISAFQETGNQRGLSVAYTNLGIAVLHMGRFEEALEHFDRSAAVAEKTGDIPCREAALFSKAFCLMDGLGDYEAAESLYRETYQMAKETHQHRKLVWHYRYFADLYRRQGRYEEARESLDYFLTSSGGMINVETRIQNLGLMVRICILCGDLEAAKENLNKAVDLAGEAPSGIADHVIHWATGAVEAFQGNARKAETHFQRALELARPGESGEFLLEYGCFLSERGETQPAREVLLQACKELGKISKPLERAALKELQTLGSSEHA